MNDYLWDPTAPPDPEVQRLEQALGRLRTATEPPPITVRQRHFSYRRRAKASAERRASRRPLIARLKPWRYVEPSRDVKPSRDLTRARSAATSVRFLAPALAAAAAIALMVGATWSSVRVSARSWPVAAMSGTPRIGSQAILRDSRLAVGQTLTTDASSTARVEVAAIGEVTVAENTRVRLVDTRAAHHQLALERGSLHAIIAAPPGQFVVDTPSARATDLGCVYTLRVDEDGGGLLSVAAGWVAFEDNGRESFVPAGASSRTDRVNGPGTPSYDDADAAFHAALDAVDSERDPAKRRAALDVVLQRARPRDAMTLWHLIPRVGVAERTAVVDALDARVAMPKGVDRDDVLRLDRASLDAWWNALGLLDTTWWRTWKRPLPQATARDTCPVTPTVRETPPRDRNADPFGQGPWHVNADRTMWAWNGDGPGWHQGLNRKVFWLRPAGTTLKITGERLDGPSSPLDVRIPCCYTSGFQVLSIAFPEAGCWKVSSTAGEHALEFVTEVTPR